MNDIEPRCFAKRVPALQNPRSVSSWIRDWNIPVVVADDGLVAKCTEIDQTEHEKLDRQDDEQVIDVKTRVGVIEG